MFSVIKESDGRFSLIFDETSGVILTVPRHQESNLDKICEIMSLKLDEGSWQYSNYYHRINNKIKDIIGGGKK